MTPSILSLQVVLAILIQWSSPDYKRWERVLRIIGKFVKIQTAGPGESAWLMSSLSSDAASRGTPLRTNELEWLPAFGDPGAMTAEGGNGLMTCLQKGRLLTREAPHSQGRAQQPPCTRKTQQALRGHLPWWGQCRWSPRQFWRPPSLQPGLDYRRNSEFHVLVNVTQYCLPIVSLISNDKKSDSSPATVACDEDG